ncbi:MAG: cupin domain-containing protein [Pseudomonadota bacterium]
MSERVPLILSPGDGRQYDLGAIHATFKADGDETGAMYNISEWWLEPNTLGPGAHAHPEDDVFYVLKGTVSFYVNEQWVDAPAGTFVLVPGGVTHDFENRTDDRAGMLNIGAPGGFEKHMPQIVDWFQTNRPKTS